VTGLPRTTTSVNTAVTTPMEVGTSTRSLAVPSTRRRGRRVLGAVAAVAAVAMALAGPGTDTGASAAHSPLAAATARSTAGGGTAQLTSSAGTPACAPPPVPAATYPPGHSYGIPFLAAVTNGEVLAGYGEWTANNLTYTVQVKKKTETYNLYPWQSKIYDITGWVTGLLQLPQLTATISPSDIVFCDQGGSGCVLADWPAGQCIQIISQYGPSPASPTPPPALGNVHPEGTACEQYPDCLPLVVALTPTGNTSLSVTGVEPDGALDLQVTTSAVTTVELLPSATTTFTCQNAPTSVPLSTVTPNSLPSTAPPPPTPPNSDYRGLQTSPEPLTGPLSSSTSTVASNDFAVPAFFPGPSGSPCTPTLTDLVNTYTGGWNSIFADQGIGQYYVNGGDNPIVAEPGWAQFSATTTVVDFGLPVGPPAGFNLHGGI